MKLSFSILLIFTLASCHSTKKSQNSSAPIQNLNVAKANLLTVNNCAVLVVASIQTPDKVDRYYVLQGAKAKEQSIPKSVLSESRDFVSLQAGSNFWVLTLKESDRYKNFLTKGADAKIIKGFGFAKYQESGLDFDTFIAELKAGKHDAKFE
ncbi:MAG: hypothetical protein ACKVU0_14640 [Saprospiraceae bacterium]